MPGPRVHHRIPEMAGDTTRKIGEFVSWEKDIPKIYGKMKHVLIHQPDHRSLVYTGKNYHP